MAIGKIKLNASNEELVRGFEWAKTKALSYSHRGDLVGDWYEAALPNREAFCIRDVAHQSNGAHFLGLAGHTYNMLKRFTDNITKSKDYCTYWEINRQNEPAPVDYRNDDDFWYNLPANFDIVDCCYRQYNWTRNNDYIEEKSFSEFYKLTFNEYIKCWDKDGDGILENSGKLPYRGIASYLESQVGINGIKVGCDLVGAMYAGYHSYSEMLKKSGDLENSSLMRDRGKHLQEILDKEWWSEKNQCYHTAIMHDGEKLIPTITGNKYEGDSVTSMPLYYKIIKQKNRINASMKILEDYTRFNVESMSYLPDVFYNYGNAEMGSKVLWNLMSPELERRDYPEVSFSIIGNIMTGILGFSANASTNVLVTYPKLSDSLSWVDLSEVPIFDGEVAYRVDALSKEQSLTSNIKLIWRAVYEGHHTKMHLNGKYVVGSLGTDANGYAVTRYSVEVTPHKRYRIDVKK